MEDVDCIVSKGQFMDYTPSRFVRQTLMPEEHCIKDARFSWVYSAQAWLVMALCVAMGYAVHRAVWFYLEQYTLTPLYVGAGVGFFFLVSMMMVK